jgi:uncharacterized protein YndB with AHSA1/START domain
MSAATTSPAADASSTADREIAMSRTFAAPRELVWKAWTEREHVERWWGPRGFTTTVLEMDVRVGGRWRFIMHGPDGTDYPNRIVYHKVEKPGRLECVHGSDQDDDPMAFDVTVTFEEEGGRTTVTNRIVFRTPEQREAKVKFGAVELGKQTLEKLEEYVASM